MGGWLFLYPHYQGSTKPIIKLKKKYKHTRLSRVADLAPCPQLNACWSSQCSMQIMFQYCGCMKSRRTTTMMNSEVSQHPLWLCRWEKTLRRPGLPISSVFFRLFPPRNILKHKGKNIVPSRLALDGWTHREEGCATRVPSNWPGCVQCLEVCWRRFWFNVGHSWAEIHYKLINL